MIIVFVLLNTNALLRLSRTERHSIADTLLSTTIDDQDVTLRMFDSEAFSTQCTDIAMFQAKDMHSFYFAMERLRDSVLITEPYFEIVEIIPTIEDGFKIFEQNRKH